jgi:hypothetical protein
MKVACAETLKPSVADGRTFEADASVRNVGELTDFFVDFRFRRFRRCSLSTFSTTIFASTSGSNRRLRVLVLCHFH